MDLSFVEIVNRLDAGLTHVEGCGYGCVGFLVNKLGEMAREGDRRAEAKLIKLLQYNDPVVRFPAAGHLGLIKSEKGLKPLEELVKKEENERVKRVAEESIIQVRAAIARKN